MRGYLEGLHTRRRWVKGKSLRTPSGGSHGWYFKSDCDGKPRAGRSRWRGKERLSLSACSKCTSAGGGIWVPFTGFHWTLWPTLCVRRSQLSARPAVLSLVNPSASHGPAARVTQSPSPAASATSNPTLLTPVTPLPVTGMCLQTTAPAPLPGNQPCGVSRLLS